MGSKHDELSGPERTTRGEHSLVRFGLIVHCDSEVDDVECPPRFVRVWLRSGFHDVVALAFDVCVDGPERVQVWPRFDQTERVVVWTNADDRISSSSRHREEVRPDVMGLDVRLAGISYFALQRFLTAGTKSCAVITLNWSIAAAVYVLRGDASAWSPTQNCSLFVPDGRRCAFGVFAARV